VVAKGIAEALVATAAGMAVAIPAVILYNYFMRKVKTVSVAMEVVSTRLLIVMGAK
jgi:biopolymer transport protein TolQ